MDTMSELNRNSKEILDILEKDMNTMEYSVIFDDELEDSEFLEEVERNKAHPVYLVVSQYKSAIQKPIEFFTKSEWSHACLSFSSKLTSLYSYNGAARNTLSGSKKGGFSRESIEKYKEVMPDNRLQVNVVFLNNHEYKIFKDRIKYLENNAGSTKYNFKGLIAVLLNKPNNKMSNNMICSQFVDSLFKLIDSSLIDKTSNLVTPKDIGELKSRKIYKVFDGKIKDYKASEVKKKITKLYNSEKTKYLTENTFIDEFIDI
jgi:hypothetical protein